MKRTRVNTTFVQQPTVALVAATTTFNYTTTTCNCTVLSASMAVDVCVDSGDVEKAAVKMPLPNAAISACFGAQLQGIKITVLPSLGTLTLNGVAVIADQVIKRTEWSGLEYTVTANTPGTDATMRFQAVADCGSSSSYLVTFKLIAEAPEVDGTPAPVTTTV